MFLRPELKNHYIGRIFVYAKEIADCLRLVDCQPELFRQRTRAPMVFFLEINVTDSRSTLWVIARHEANRWSVYGLSESDTNRRTVPFNIRCQGH